MKMFYKLLFLILTLSILTSSRSLESNQEKSKYTSTKSNKYATTIIPSIINNQPIKYINKTKNTQDFIMESKPKYLKEAKLENTIENSLSNIKAIYNSKNNTVSEVSSSCLTPPVGGLIHEINLPRLQGNQKLNISEILNEKGSKKLPDKNSKKENSIGTSIPMSLSYLKVDKDNLNS